MNNQQFTIRQKVSIVLTDLFPVDIINIILPYADSSIVIQLQDFFPNVLKYIIINEKYLRLINQHNYQYVRELRCIDWKEITNNDIEHFSLCKNLTKLNCGRCEKITDECIQHFLYLTELDCSSCPKITDASIGHLFGLTQLVCINCKNITEPSSRLALRGKQSLLINSCYSS
jgi:hypothetical protein